MPNRRDQRTQRRRGEVKRSGRYLNAKAGWHVIGEQRVYFRSQKERRHAEHLETLRRAGVITEWTHEPHRFDFPGIRRGTTSYLPDFRVTYPDGRIEYHEVKGWLDPKSKTQLRRMAKYHPGIVLRLFGAKMPDESTNCARSKAEGNRSHTGRERRRKSTSAKT